MNETRLGTLTLVTPPSIIDSNNETFCLLNFNEQDKNLFMKYVDSRYKNPNEDITVYIANKDEQYTEKWLTEALEKSNIVIVRSSKGFKFLKTNNEQQIEEFFNGGEW